jgi:predicted Zn-dependent peptidase
MAFSQARSSVARPKTRTGPSRENRCRRRAVGGIAPMIRARTLPNGLRVVTERVRSVRSCGIGLWLEIGSRHEAPDEHGLTHFIEHMLFKGTRRRNVQQLADAINLLGGYVNAYTTQEMLCVHAKTIDRKAPLALELMCEMLTASIFPPDEIRRERQVVLEECRSIEDNPDEYSVDLFLRNLWPDHPLGRPVIGRRATIRRFRRDQVRAFWERQFQPERLVVSIAGSFDAAACNKVIRRWLAGLPRGDGGRPSLARPDRRVSPRQSVLRRPIEQAYFCLGARALHRCDPRRFAFSLLNMILGGGASSRLFREVREKRGLAYSIGSFTQFFSDCGYFAVTAGTNPRTLQEVLAITREEIERIGEEPVPERELELARAQALDGIVMGLENMDTRMMRLADGLLTHGRVVPVDEIFERLTRVTPAEIRAVARRYLRARPQALALIGPRGERRRTRGMSSERGLR